METEKVSCGHHKKFLSFFQFNMDSDGLYGVQCDVPVQTIQFVKSRDRIVNEQYHDPAMIVIPPLEQYTNNFLISPPPLSENELRTAYPINELLIIARYAVKDEISELLAPTDQCCNRFWEQDHCKKPNDPHGNDYGQRLSQTESTALVRNMSSEHWRSIYVHCLLQQGQTPAR